MLDRTFFAPIAHDAGRVRRRAAETVQRRDRTRSSSISSRCDSASRPAPPPTTVVETVEPPLRAVTVGPPPKLAAGPCGDWRATIGASFVDQGTRAEAAFAGRYPASCGERDWWVSLLDHPTYVHGMFETYFRAAGGRFAGRWRDGVAPAGATPFATFDSPPLWDVVRDINKLSNNVMARQLFLTLATARAPPPATVARATEAVPGVGVRATQSQDARARARQRVRPVAPRANQRRQPRAAAGRGQREPRARRVRELALGRRDGRHAATTIPERHGRRAGAAQDGNARRRARAGGLRHRQRWPPLRRGRDRQPRERESLRRARSTTWCNGSTAKARRGTRRACRGRRGQGRELDSGRSSPSN